MKLFLDTADVDVIQDWIATGVIDGVTTNPSIMLKCGAVGKRGMLDRARTIMEVIHPRPLSVEVVTDNRPEMIAQAKAFRDELDGNLAVKIPITTSKGESCLGVVKTLFDLGIMVNVTAMMTVNQLILAAKAGGRYLSLFGGRIDDEGSDAVRVIGDCREWMDKNYYELNRMAIDFRPEIIVGSTRTVKNIEDWALAGAHIITVTPEVLDKMLVNARTKETVVPFLADGEKALHVPGEG